MLIDDITKLSDELDRILLEAAKDPDNFYKSKVYKEILDTIKSFKAQGYNINYKGIVDMFNDLYEVDFPVNYIDDMVKGSYEYIDNTLSELVTAYSKDYQRLLREVADLERLGASRSQAVSEAMKRLEPGRVLDGAGRRQKIRTLIERDLRATSAELAEKMANDVAKEIGSTYFYIPDHNGAGPDHAPLQDKYYGTPTGTFTDDFGDRITIHDEGILSSIDRPMFTGWGCRHMKIPQLAGLKISKSFDPLKEFDKSEGL